MRLCMISSALTLLLVTVGCGRTASHISPPEIVNNVEGSFTFKGETVKLSHAYASRVTNEDDSSKQDVLIVFTDRPAPWKVIDVGGSESNIWEKARDGELRALSVRLKDDKSATFTIYHGGDADVSYPPPIGADKETPPKAEFKPVGFLPNLVEGRVSAKNEQKATSEAGADAVDRANPAPPLYQFDASFKVGLRSGEWTGVYYKYPPTNLEQGKASGQLVVDGNAVKLNHAYARQSSYDLFEKTTVALLLSEKPIAVETLKGDSEDDLLRAALEAGNSYVICDTYSTSQPPVHPRVWTLAKLSGSTKASELSGQDLGRRDSLLSADVDLSQFDNKALDGKIYTKSPFKWFDHTYEIDVSFNAPVVTIGDAVNAPVVAGNGQPLPVGGGAVGRAYLSFVKAVSLTQNFQGLRQLLQASQSAGAYAEMTKSLEKVPAEEEQHMFELLKGALTIKTPSVEGGFTSGDKATLWVSGTDDGKKVTARINMHLENGQWKVGMGAIQVE